MAESPPCPSPALDPSKPRWLRWTVHEDVQALVFAAAMTAAAAGGMLGRGRLPDAGRWSQGAQLDVAVALTGGATFVWLLQRLRGACTNRWWPAAVVPATIAAVSLSVAPGGYVGAALFAVATGLVGGLLWPQPVLAAGGLHGAALARAAAAMALWSGAVGWPVGLGAVAAVLLSARLSERSFGAGRWPWAWAVAIVALGGLPLDLAPRAHAALEAAALLWALMAVGRLALEAGSAAKVRLTS